MQRRSVAIMGASSDRAKFGNKAVRAYIDSGWDVFPINPNGGEIEGLIVYRSLDDVTIPLDRVTTYLPPEIGLSVLDAIAEAEPGEFLINPGAENDKLLSEAQRLGIHSRFTCSIVDIGQSPTDYPD